MKALIPLVSEKLRGAPLITGGLRDWFRTHSLFRPQHSVKIEVDNRNSVIMKLSYKQIGIKSLKSLQCGKSNYIKKYVRNALFGV